MLPVNPNRTVPETPFTVPVKVARTPPTSTVSPLAVVNAVAVSTAEPVKPPVRANVDIAVTNVLGPAVLVLMRWKPVPVNVPLTEVDVVADAVGSSKSMGSAKAKLIFLIF